MSEQEIIAAVVVGALALVIIVYEIWKGSKRDADAFKDRK